MSRALVLQVSIFLRQLPQRPLSRVNSERVDLSDLVAVDTHRHTQHPDSSSSLLLTQIDTFFSRKMNRIWLIAFLKFKLALLQMLISFLLSPLMVEVKRGVVMKM